MDPAGIERVVGGTASRFVRWLYSGAESQLQDLVYRAALDPELARRLVLKATPDNLNAIAEIGERTLGQRLRGAAGNVVRQLAPAGANAGAQGRD
ncbi:hypothetical protein [Roseomonas sp. BN140053]|uniref:hypothetical protein n=1 Tax=Roseomonas sp. BN140053 TaxID=3391898 RepID=UPI0039EC7DA2